MVNLTINHENISVPEGTTAEVIWPDGSRKNFDPGRHQAKHVGLKGKK